MTEFYGADYRARIRSGEAETMLDGPADYEDSDIEGGEEGGAAAAPAPVEAPPRLQAALSAGDDSAS
eukprot:11515476-Alexandrium_andersonii.AAC.1